MLTVNRYHDFSCAHRAVGDDGPCRNIHGHNYRVTFTIGTRSGDLGPLGRVIDFSAIKNGPIAWIEANWDHRLLLWDQDPLYVDFTVEGSIMPMSWAVILTDSIVAVPFNTSTELMAEFLLIESQKMMPDGIEIVRVEIMETRKCGASASIQSL